MLRIILKACLQILNIYIYIYVCVCVFLTYFLMFQRKKYLFLIDLHFTYNKFICTHKTLLVYPIFTCTTNNL